MLYVSSTAPDTDFFARLVDEFPDEQTSPEDVPWYRVRCRTSITLGPAREIAYGMVRVRHRNSLDVEELLTPDEVTQLRIELGPTACCFQAGHRIRLEITSNDYPNHDRNHNTGRIDLADIELVAAPSLSPDGNRLAFVRTAVSFFETNRGARPKNSTRYSSNTRPSPTWTRSPCPCFCTTARTTCVARSSRENSTSLALKRRGVGVEFTRFPDSTPRLLRARSSQTAGRMLQAHPRLACEVCVEAAVVYGKDQAGRLIAGLPADIAAPSGDG